MKPVFFPQFIALSTINLSDKSVAWIWFGNQLNLKIRPQLQCFLSGRRNQAGRVAIRDKAGTGGEVKPKLMKDVLDFFERE